MRGGPTIHWATARPQKPDYRPETLLFNCRLDGEVYDTISFLHCGEPLREVEHALGVYYFRTRIMLHDLGNVIVDAAKNLRQISRELRNRFRF